MSLYKDETAPEWIDPGPRLIENIVTLKRLTDPEKSVVTRCQSSELMTAFYLLADASVQGFGSSLWDHEGLRYYLKTSQQNGKKRPTIGRRELISLCKLRS